MEHSVEQSEERGEPSFRIDLLGLCKKVQSYLSEQGVAHFCKVSIKQRGLWIELAGNVDSHRTRSAIFSLMPAKGGRKYIIDKLRVVPDPMGKEVWV